MTSTLFAPSPWVAAPSSTGGAVADVVPLRRPRAGSRRTLTEARTAAGLTISQLARALHLSRPTVSYWEKGVRRPARAHWPRIAAVLGLDEAEVAALFADHPPARLDAVPLPCLASVRRRAGVTQRALAERVGVAPTTLSMWETAGVAVSAALAARLAAALDTDASRLAAQPPAASVRDPRPLRHMRREARMSQREAAAHVGIAVGSLARYEAGERRAPVAVARRMAAAYRRPVSEVLSACGIALLPLPAGVRWRPEDLPKALRAARIAAGLTKVALGRAIGRSGQAVRSWETGRSRPGPAVCRRLEVVLGLPAGKLPS
jgi:transcriptional regulator with XRE-family HTH domain